MALDAIAVGTAISAGASLLGGRSAGKAAKEQARLQKEQMAMQQKALEDNLKFQSEQLDRWEGIFGNVQQNLKDYYDNLGPEKFKSMGMQNVATQFQQAQNQLDQQLAQRGLTRSGAAGRAYTDLYSRKASELAQVDVQADEYVAQQKMNWMNMGMQERQGIVGNIGQAYTATAAGHWQAAGVYGQQAAASQQAQYGAMAGIGQAIGTGIGSYYQIQALQDKGTGGSGAGTGGSGGGTAAQPYVTGLNEHTPNYYKLPDTAQG